MTGVGGAARSGLCEIDFDWLPSKGQSGWTMLVTKTGTRTDLHNTAEKIHKLASYQLKASSIWGHRHQIS